MLKRTAWRHLYQFLAGRFPTQDWTFMNYGYEPLDDSPLPTLDAADERNRYFIQLYHYVATAENLAGLEVLEVGSGRGGGASYIKRYLRPTAMTGVDFSQRAINFCDENHRLDGLSFRQGDAESLPFDDGTFDAVVNIESSHCYGSMEKFVQQVERVLRPGGYFLFADLRGQDEIQQLEAQMAGSGMHIKRKVEITAEVLRALDCYNEKKLALLRELVPVWLVRPFSEFAGVKGSQIYENLKSGAIGYYHYALQK